MLVEFYLINGMEVLHFAPVARALARMGADARFVSQRGEANTKGRYYDADTAEAVMDQLQLPYVSHPNPNADLALTTYLSFTLRDYRKLRARFMYGVNLVWYDSRSWLPLHHKGFDLYLMHGPFNRWLATQYVDPKQVAMIGYPRFDTWFRNPCDQNLVREKYGVAGSKPTILYLPTWQHRSSIDTFADSIFALSDRFEIVVKPHHMTYQFESDRMRKLKSGPARMLNPNTLPEEVFTLGDVVISDIDSGGLTEAIFLKKHTVCLATTEQLDNLLLPEIKQEIPICLAPEELSQKVDEATALDFGSEGLQKLRRYMFDSSEGADAERAAKAIVEFTDTRRRMPWSSVRSGFRWRKEYLRHHVGRIARRYLLPKRNNRRAGG